MRAAVLTSCLVLLISISSPGASARGAHRKPALDEAVEVKGTLHTHRIAIGGETTGVEITTKSGDTYELALESSSDIKKASAWNGKSVAVRGHLKVVRGVERPVRRILQVDRLQLTR